MAEREKRVRPAAPSEGDVSIEPVNSIVSAPSEKSLDAAERSMEVDQQIEQKEP